MALPLCSCGCGGQVKTKDAKWLKGHSNRGIVRSEEYRAKQRQSKLGKSNTALIGRKYSKEHREAISGGLIGRHLSEEHRAHISIGNTGKKMSPEAIEKRRIKVIGQKRSKKSRNQMSLSHIGKPGYWNGKQLYEETKEKIREKRLNQILPKRDTYIEVIIQSELKNRTIDFQTHYPILGQPDIFIQPNLCIFCDGDYWHNYPIGRKKDKRITEQLQEEGFIVLRFWEYKIRENSIECVNKIMEVV